MTINKIVSQYCFSTLDGEKYFQFVGWIESITWFALIQYFNMFQSSKKMHIYTKCNIGNSNWEIHVLKAEDRVIAIKGNIKHNIIMYLFEAVSQLF